MLLQYKLHNCLHYSFLHLFILFSRLKQNQLFFGHIFFFHFSCLILRLFKKLRVTTIARVLP